MTETPTRTGLLELRWISPVIIALILVIFGVAIVVVTRELRRSIRQQMITRDGEVLRAVLQMQLTNELESVPGLSLEEPAQQVALLLKTSRLRGVVAARLFDGKGGFVLAFPQNVRSGVLQPEVIESMHQLRTHARYFDAADLDALFTPDATQSQSPRLVPLIEINVPFYHAGQSRVFGVAQFFSDGQLIAREFVALDHKLWAQAVLVFLIGGGMMAGGLAWTLHRLQRANAELISRSASLARANQELTLAAKMSAVGAISAHLIHSLRNPVTGLHHMVSGSASDPSSAAGFDWQTALKATQELRGLIAEIGKMLKTEPTLHQPQATLFEVCDLVLNKVRPMAEAGGVSLVRNLQANAVLDHRDANLSALVLENLLRNAVQATARGKTATLSTRPEGTQVVCEVADEGPGISGAVRANLFNACESTKPGGLGLGLAISRQLAGHMEAVLELVRTSDAGCVFALRLPVPAAEPSAPAGKLPLASTFILN